MAGYDKAWWRPVGRGRLPLWLKVLYTLFLCVLVPVYWHHYGPSNFLWACDIALFVICAAFWLESPLLTSMMAIGVLPFEVAWTIDLVAGSRLLGMASYMFDAQLPLYLRGLSLYHTVLPPLMIFMLCRLGYDRRALMAQTLLVWLVLPLTYLLTEPAENINLVFGLGKEPQTFMNPLLYLALEMILLPLVVCLPAHLLLQRLFDRR
ncbi:MAG: membrane-associated protein [Alphaproteobacteria bacterium]|nr:membrane-associated protein [Alphaproteobacteria bacterium]